MKAMRALTAFVCCVFALDCTTFQARRSGVVDDNPIGKGFPKQGPVQVWEYRTNPEYYVGTIEFSERGHLRYPDASKRVLDHVAALAQPEGATIVVFVHGWQHSGAWEDENQEQFRRVLSQVATLQDQVFETTMRPFRLAHGFVSTKRPPVIGIALVWRGKSLNIPKLNIVTFYDRKIAAHQAGGERTIEDFFLAKAEDSRNVLRRLQDIYLANNTEKRVTTMTLVGHSFGAAFLYSAVEDVLREQLRQEGLASTDSLNQFRVKPPDVVPLLAGLGDALILVNPAFEARRYREFGRLTDAPRKFDPCQTPKLIVLSSNADKPNRFAFPVGRYLSTMLWPPSWFQWSQRRTALGFFHADQTHYLHLGAPSTWPATENGWQFNEHDQAHLQRIAKAPIDFDVSKDSDYGPFQLDPKDNRKFLDHSPFIVARVSKHIISEHSDIFSAHFIDFLVKFIGVLEVQNIKVRADQQEGKHHVCKGTALRPAVQ